MSTESLDRDLPKLFSDKVLHCWTQRTGVVLVGSRFVTIGGRLFVVGTTPPGWPGYENKSAAIAWDPVATFYLYDTVVEWQASQRAWRAAKKKLHSKSRFSFGR